MTTTQSLEQLAELLAKELHVQANERRQRAINAAKEVDVDADETDRWRVAFSTSYQTLRGVALAVENVAAALRTPTATPSDVEKAYREGWTDAWYASQTDIGPIDVEQVDREWLVSNARLALSAIEGEKK